jgi:hypothetical protein
LQVSPLGGIRDETWRGQGIRKRSVSWNLPKLSQVWRCSGGFGLRTALNHLRTKPFVGGTWNSSSVAACSLQSDQASRGHQPRLLSACKKRLSGARYATKCKHKEHLKGRIEILNVSPSVDMLPFDMTTRLLYHRGREFRRDLWITLLFSPNSSRQTKQTNHPL